MSKKDKQHQHLQQPLTTQLMNQPEQAPVTGGDPASIGREARIQHLEAENVRLRAEIEQAKTEHSSAIAALDGVQAGLEKERDEAVNKAKALHSDLELLAKSARHGAPPEGFEPKTAEGKEALEQVVLLGRIATDQRERAQAQTNLANAYSIRVDEAEKRAKALHSDLMVLEQTAAGRAPNIDLQTDPGKSAAHALSEVLTSLDKMNEQRLDGPALPLAGWASDTARQLVEAVPQQDRVLLLGDLLAQLLPHTGEEGQNETASDVLKRIVVKLNILRSALDDAAKTIDRYEQERRDTDLRMVKIQSAMVARRAPDAEAGALLDGVVRIVSRTLGSPPNMQVLPFLESALRELMGLRAFFSEAPLTAVAVRDDGAKGPVRERYSLLVLTWDGKAVSMRYVEETRPWGDIRPYLEQTVLKNLIPAAYR